MGTRRYARVLLASLLVLVTVLAGGLAGVVNLAAAAPIYTIVVQVSPVGSGTVDVVPNETDYELTASPAPGWHFVDWSGDVTVADNPVTVTKDTATIVTANFAVDTFTITPTAGAHGSITPATAQTVNYNDDQAFTIAAANGYHVADVLVDGLSVGVRTAYKF